MSLVLNRISLAGYIVKKKCDLLDSTGSWMYKGELFFDEHLVGDSVGLTAWGDVAELLGTVTDRLNVMVVGHLSLSTYVSKCRSCGNSIDKTWVDVTVASFRVLI